MAAKEMSAGIVFEILGFANTINRIGSIHHGFFMVQQAAQGAVSAVVGLVKVFKLTDAASKFEEGLVAIQQRSQATRRELDLLRVAAIDAGLRTQFSPQEAVDGLLELAGMGFRARESIALLQPVLDLAAGSLGQLGLADAATAVAGTMRAFRLETNQAGIVTDKLLRITQMTNFQARDFASGLSKAAGEAGHFGQTIDDTLILMGLLRNMNLPATVASTAVRNAVRRLAGDAKVRNLVEAQGVQIYDKLTGKMRPVLDIIADLSGKTGKLTRAQKDLIDAKVFGARGIFSAGAFEGARFSKVLADGTVQVLKGRDAIKAYRSELAKSAGTAKKFREALLKTFEGQKKLLRGIIQTAGVLAGEPLIQVLAPVVRFIVNFANEAVAAFRRIPAPVKRFFAALLIGGTVFGIFAASVIGLKIVLASLFFVMNAVGVTFLSIAMTAATLTAAFALLVGAVVAVVAAFKTNFAGVATLFDRIVWAVKGTWAVMTAWKDGTSQISKQMAADLNKAGVLDFAIRLGGWFGRVKDAMIVMWQQAKQMSGPLATALTPLANALKELFSAVGAAGQRIFEAIFGPFQKLKGTRKDITGPFFSIFNALVTGITFVSNVFASVINFVSKMIRTAIKPGFFQNIFGKVASVFKVIWSILQPVFGTLAAIAINILPAMFTVFSAVWDVVKAVGSVIAALVVGLFGGLDLMAGGGGILPVIQMIANVFTFVFQIVAIIVRVIGVLARWLSYIIAPVVFAISATFGSIVGLVVWLVKLISGALVSALNFVLIKVGAMMKPFEWLFDKLNKLNPFAKKADAIAKQTSSPTAVSTVAGNMASNILSLNGISVAKPTAGATQKSFQKMPILPAGGVDPALLAQSTSAAAAKGQDDTVRQSLEKLAGNDDDKKRLLMRQAVASEAIANAINSPADLVEFLTQALASAQQKAVTDGYGNG